MTPMPLDRIGLRLRDHKSALWWLALLYRRPDQFFEALSLSAPKRQLAAGLLLLLHALPYATLLSALVSLLTITLGSPKDVFTVRQFLSGIASAVSIGALIGTLFGSALRIMGSIRKAVPLGIIAGLAFGISYAIMYVPPLDLYPSIFVFGAAKGCALGIGSGIAAGIVFGITPTPERDITRIWFYVGVGMVAGIAEGLFEWITRGAGRAIPFGIATGIAYSAASSRAYYHVIHPFFVWPKVRGNSYPYHPVAWDDLCVVLFPGLDRLLVAYSEVNYSAAESEIERLIGFYPAQRGQALRARIRLLAREAGQTESLARLDAIVAKLPEGEKGFLSQTRQLRQWINEIAAQQTRLDMLERPFFREPTARALYAEIENFQHRIAGFEEPLTTEFRKAAQHWQEIARRQLEEAQAVVSKQPTPQVFRSGDPVDRNKEAFVPRHGIVGQVEQQVMLATGCPGLVLYGRRRTGKSTVLRNLSGFLPPSVLPVVISMQDPKAFTSQRSFIHLIAWESGNKADVAGMPDEISGLYDFLTNCNSRLQGGSKRLLLAVDEYELIDSKIAEGVFTEDLLRMVRESIQSHRNITWIFSGSHEITELTGAPWTSYLVSARTIPVPVFKPAETRLLLTEPLKYSSLWQQGEPRRPRFEPGFWGDGGIECIHKEAGGWPHLVQLIAEAVVDFMNDEGANAVSPALLDRALANCVVRGHNVLYELMRRECTLPGEWDYLSAFRYQPEQSAPEDEAIYRSLRRRELITEENGYWRLKVPLMARWLRERG